MKYLNNLIPAALHPHFTISSCVRKVSHSLTITGYLRSLIFTLLCWLYLHFFGYY